MPKNMTYLNKQLKTRNSEKEYDHKPIGSILKAQRLKLGLTQTQVAEDICSISYLSKLENGLVKLSDKFSAALFKRLHLENYQFSIDDTMKEDLTHLLQHIIEKKDIPSFYSEKYLDKIDYQSRLVQMTMYVCEKQFDKVDEIYELLSPYSTKLNDLELGMFLLNASYMLTETGHYEASYEMLLKSPYIEVEDKVLKLLTEKQKCMNAFKMQKSNVINQLYDDLFLSFAQAQLYDHLCEIQVEMLIYQALNWPIEKTKVAVSSLYKMTESDKDYILARAYYHHLCYQDAYVISNKYQDKSAKWHILHLMILAHLAEKNKHILGVIDNVEVFTQEDLRVKEFIMMKSSLPLSDFVEFLRQDFFTKQWVIDDNFSLSYIMLTAQDVFSKVHCYKDATKVMNKYYRMNRSLTGSSVSL